MVDINTLKGMADVEFDFAVSGELKRVFRAAATKLSGQRGSRAAWRTTGSTDFDGHFSTIFTQNGVQQLQDLDEVATALRSVATKVETVEQAAREENQRRQAAREWAQRQEDRNWFEERRDDIFGGEDPPSTNFSDSGPSASVPAATPAARQTPAPGSGGGGGGGGSSSARPSNLRSFATSTADGDTELASTSGALQHQCDLFASSCSWATLDASGPITGLREWLRLNGVDASWATTVADAFEKAGGEGNVSTLSNSSIAAALAASQVPTRRGDIEVDPPTAYGSPPTTGYSNDPVNTASGNFVENETDLDFTGLSAVLSMTRSYNSRNRAVGAFGPGWTSWTEAGLSLTDESARLRLPDGREIVFPRLGVAWDRAAGENLWLQRDGGGYVVTNASGLRWLAGPDGRLRSTSSGPGTRIEFGYDDRGRLHRLTHQFGRSVELTWDDEGRVAAATASDGRHVDYRYDHDGRLVAARTPAGTRSYRWNDAGLVEAVVDPDGVVEAENSYDELGRVIRQRSPHGRITRFAYLGRGVTSVSDDDGTRSNTWIADARGRLVGVIDADDQRQSTSYDPYGNPVLVSERDGSTTVNVYDDRGRRTEQVLPSGARISCAYDDADRLVEQRVITGDGADAVEAVNRFAYAGESRDPAELVDPEGGVTAMTWTDGLLQQITDPEGVTLRFTHDAYGDLVATTDADGNTARLERDALGRVVAATTPLGHTTTYRYDGTGPLVSRQDPDGSIWRYEHTAGGRVSALIDPLGGRTEIEHSLGSRGSGEQARTVDPLGRATTSSYDDLGNRIRAELPDGSAWEFGYDALSRLTTSTDPSGGVWQLGYDQRGFVVTSSDATGVEQTSERNRFGQPTRTGDLLAQSTTDYDALGREVASTGPDGLVARRGYDRCGRLVEISDPTGATTRIERDRAGRAVHITHPMGTTFHYAYDRCGRRVATVDTDGSRYELGFDADGRLVHERWPTGEEVWLRFDACARLVERYEPGRGVSSWAYDKVGRVVRTNDGLHGRRRFRYDAAGQLVAVVNALGGETRFDYDALGRCVGVVDPLGGRTVRSFDAMGRITSQTDPLGRTTRYGYDAAGRQTRQVDAAGVEQEWRYERTGRLVQTLAGGRVLADYERDFAARLLRVRDGDVAHELAYDPNGQLVARMRRSASGGGVGLSWSYDADGRRTSFTRSDGSQTRYEYDQAGRVAALTEPGLGRAVIERDAIGRIVSMVAPGLHATWTWAGGHVARHVVTREGVSRSTELERDETGRVVAQVSDGVRTTYAYDQAGQLIEARSLGGGGADSLTTYGYDAGGRLVREVTDGAVTSYRYDAAGQLLDQRAPQGRTEFSYDAVGRRTREVGPEADRRFGWDPRGFLAHITTITHTGDAVTARTQPLQVDALGELSSVGGEAVTWDTAASTPALAQIGEFSISSYGPLTGLLPDSTGALGGDGAAAMGRWLEADWRPRSTGADPWGVAPGVSSPALPSGVQIGGHGSLLVDGLEWMQARVYDPASRGFLSTDPMDPVWGSGWSGNPYAFAGNDPLNASDPWGLRPVTDQELQAYRDANNGGLSNAWNATTSWVKDNWEYLAAGAMIVAGVALMCTGIGGPAGIALMAGSGALLSAGASVAIQKHQNGSVDWGQVGTEALMGAIPIPGAGALGGVARTAGRTVVREGLETGARTATREAAETTAVTATRNGARDLESTCVRGACFTAGTQVLMGDGSSKSVEDIRAGDEVASTDPESGETHARRVVETYLRDRVSTYEVAMTTGSVTSTAEHPFYVRGRGWTPVSELRAGDELVDAKGRDVQVRSVERTGASATVYNFQVDDLHTYHVESGDAWILVHNECQVLDPNTVRFSQNTMGETSSHVAAARAGESRAVDVVRMPDNALTSVDNRTVAAARETGTDLSARVHHHTDSLPTEQVDRFLGRKGEVPQTWGDAVTNRVGNQSAAFRNENPYGSYEVPRISGG